MTVRRDNAAQALCNELFFEVEGAMCDAWISDDACTNDPKEYLRFVYGSLLALEEAEGIIKRFLKRHGHRPQRRRISTKEIRARAGEPVSVFSAALAPKRKFEP